jgi:excisionase family DNA binding protein
MRASTMTVYRMVHGGRLSAARIGRSSRIPAVAVTSPTTMPAIAG